MDAGNGGFAGVVAAVALQQLDLHVVEWSRWACRKVFSRTI
jgi:hypothetical protein